MNGPVGDPGNQRDSWGRFGRQPENATHKIETNTSIHRRALRTAAGGGWCRPLSTFCSHPLGLPIAAEAWLFSERDEVATRFPMSESCPRFSRRTTDHTQSRGTGAGETAGFDQQVVRGVLLVDRPVVHPPGQ